MCAPNQLWRVLSFLFAAYYSFHVSVRGPASVGWHFIFGVVLGHIFQFSNEEFWMQMKIWGETVAKLCLNVLAEPVFPPCPPLHWHINEVLLKQCCLLISKAQRRWSNIAKQIATICMCSCASSLTPRGSRCALAHAWYTASCWELEASARAFCILFGDAGIFREQLKQRYPWLLCVCYWFLLFLGIIFALMCPLCAFLHRRPHLSLLHCCIDHNDDGYSLPPKKPLSIYHFAAGDAS